MADSAEFKTAAEQVRNLKKTPSNDDYAKLYSLFKQATCGDCDKSKPSAVNLLETGKYDAWLSRKGMSKADAAKQYIDGAKEAVAKYGQK